ncbi:linear amide C-N hydrolase [Methylocella sp.]|uniref:linear amide C-N hydrolase n=1 Tax=Methylocella sp. TaxID=1978226 RepID=UPI00378503BE
MGFAVPRFAAPCARSRLRVVALLACGLAAAPALACTSFLLKAKDGTPVYGRTMEFGLDLESSVFVAPRGYAYDTQRPQGAAGPKWRVRHAYVGVTALGLPFVADGMNEKGLAVGALYLPGFAGYAAPSPANTGRAYAPYEFASWLLSTFATVAEVRAGLDGVEIAALPTPGSSFVLPLHFTVHDASGASLVIEPIDGKLKVHDNPLGVLTNAPTFDWHLTNIRNYVKLSPVAAPPLKIMGETFAPLGEGSGLLGVPGDVTPPSRFIRALGFAVSAEPGADGPQTVRVAEHVANNFDIPAGLVRDPEKGAPRETTQWTAIADLRARKYYIKTYTDQTLREIDLMSFDLDAREPRVAPLKPLAKPPALEFPEP